MLKLTIEVTNEGSLALNGIPDNPIFGYGLLEVGRQQMMEYYQKREAEAQRRVELAPGPLPPFPGDKQR